MSGRKFAVTGHKGFVGSQLFATLQKGGSEVLGWDPGIISKDTSFDDFLDTLGDFLPDVVFHVGADSNTLATAVNEVMVSNYLFTRRLMEWADSRPVDIIFSSSAACYGNESGRPENLYAWSKLAAEDYVRLSGGVSLRYFNVYGPGEEHKGRMASFVFQAWKASREGQFPKLFPGRPKRDFVYVEDVVEANLFAAEVIESIRGGVFEVGTGFARLFEDCLEGLAIDWEYADLQEIPDGYQFFTRADVEHFLPGWKPRFSLEEGLEKYARYLGSKS